MIPTSKPKKQLESTLNKTMGIHFRWHQGEQSFNRH